MNRWIVIVGLIGLFGSVPPLVSLADAAELELKASDVKAFEIEQLAKVLDQMDPLLRRIEGRLALAKTKKQKRMVEQAFETEATQLITTAGLSVERYQALLRLTKSDPTFGKQVTEAVQRIRAKATPKP